MEPPSASPCIAVMPVYNEQACLQRVCLDWIAQMLSVGGLLLVVDDGSRDNSPSILRRLAQQHSALIVITQANAGHGPAILNGYAQALAFGCEYVFQVDSDGETPAALFPQLWTARHTAPFLLGRRTGRRSHPLRLALSTIHRRMLSALFGVDLHDPNIPFRLMRAPELAALLAELPPGLFAPNVFLSLLAARRHWLAAGPDVPLASRAGGIPSIRGWRTFQLAVRCTSELLRFRRHTWRCLPPYRP